MPYADRDKQREYQRRWRASRRKKWFADNGPCRCGSWNDLELHHLDPEKKVSHSIWSWSWKRIEEEASKCVVLCRECHKKVTSEQKQRPVSHGTTTGYWRGCRCDKCKEVKSEYDRFYRMKGINNGQEKERDARP